MSDGNRGGASPPRTAREALVAELLADADRILDRNEDLIARSDQLQQRCDQLASTLGNATAHLADDLRKAGQETSNELARASTAARQALESDSRERLKASRDLLQEARQVADTLKGRNARLLWLCIVAGGMAGALVSLTAALLIVMLL